jgi:hypothetical protein
MSPWSNLTFQLKTTVGGDKDLLEDWDASSRQLAEGSHFLQNIRYCRIINAHLTGQELEAINRRTPYHQ